MNRSKWIKLPLFLLLLIAIERFCYLKTDGFRLSKTACEGDHALPLPLPSFDTEKINQILGQNFHFLSSGKQCYVFRSEDDKTVLKLFKHHHFGLSSRLLSYIPFTASIIQERENRLLPVIKSVLLSSLHLPEETALLYIHFGKTDQLLPTITLYDKLNIAHPCDLDRTDFVLQRYAEPTQHYLSTLLNEGRIEEAKVTIEKLTRFMNLCSLKGIKNKDPKILENTGIYQGEPQLLDIGSLTLRKNSKNPHPEHTLQAKIETQLNEWLNINYPGALQ